MTTRIESLRALQARIRESKGADRELDRDVHEVLTGDCTHRETEYYRVQSDSGFTCKKCRKDMYGCREWPAYTASLDACLVLMAAVLPEHKWDREVSGAFFVWATLNGHPFMIVGSGREPLSTDCHAFLDAIFSAAISEEEAKQPEKTT